MVHPPIHQKMASNREKIRLVSEEGTGTFYTTTKNKRTMTGKFSIKKFDKKLGKHCMFKEAKIK